jgi:hypothetical protein
VKAPCMETGQQCLHALHYVLCTALPVEGCLALPAT